MKIANIGTILGTCSALLFACSSPKAETKSEPTKEQTEAHATEQTEAPKPPESNDIPAPPDVAAAPADAEKTASGLQSKVLTAGSGESPEATDKVKVHYTGWVTSGAMFDSSVKRGQPATFPLNGVIKGWTEGVQLMKVGEKRRFWIPGELGYGKAPEGYQYKPGGRPMGTLVFDIELLEVVKPPKAPETPKDLKNPKGTKKTASGLKYKVLQEGSGDAHPKATDRVEVHYSGWTTDGDMFDSSVMRGQSATFPLNGVIKGWTEGVQLMKVGDKVRFWIPGELAYGEAPKGWKYQPGSRPLGTLVFDVELLSIQ